jgi:signal transduction histidine kinase
MANSDNASRPGLDERKDADKTLAASALARLRALDAMLGGVAHDLNNALSVVLMNLDVMQQDTALMSKHQRRIDGMLDAMTGASALVRHLLNFAHSRRPEPEVVSVAETLSALIELLQVAVGKEVDIVVERNAVGPCCVMVDLASFEVAVVHAALQLAAVIPGGGVLTFRLGEGDPPDDQIVLALEAEPRGPQPGGDDRDPPDLTLVEHFAREAQGHLTSVVTVDSTRYRFAIYLPACHETTTV